MRRRRFLTLAGLAAVASLLPRQERAQEEIPDLLAVFPGQPGYWWSRGSVEEGFTPWKRVGSADVFLSDFGGRR